MSAQDLLAALQANFDGHDTLRHKLMQIPRFGMEDPAADAMCDRVLHSVCKAAANHKTRFNGILKPMIFNFVWTPSASRDLSARCDGSLAGDRIGHGLTPHNGAMTKGITAAMNSVARP